MNHAFRLRENKPNQTQFQTQRLRGYEWLAKKGAKSFYARRRVATGKAGKEALIYLHQEVIEVPEGMVRLLTTSIVTGWTIARRTFGRRARLRTRGTPKNGTRKVAQGIKEYTGTKRRRGGGHGYRLTGKAGLSGTSMMKKRQRGLMTRRHGSITGNSRYLILRRAQGQS